MSKHTRYREITKSYSRTVQFTPYEPTNFFCSQKAYCREDQAKATAKAVFKFCRDEVLADIEAERLARFGTPQETEAVTEAVHPASAQNFSKWKEREGKPNGV